MTGPENLIPICPQGCHPEANCCKCCIYIPNLNEDDLRTMQVEQVKTRIESDPRYAEERSKAYNARYHSPDDN